MTIVKPHTRQNKSGKVTQVRSHNRQTTSTNKFTPNFSIPPHLTEKGENGWIKHQVVSYKRGRPYNLIYYKLPKTNYRFMLHYDGGNYPYSITFASSNNPHQFLSGGRTKRQNLDFIEGIIRNWDKFKKLPKDELSNMPEAIRKVMGKY